MLVTINYYSFALIAVCLALLSCTGTLRSRQPAKQTMDLYLLVGQSNMAGRGIITDSLMTTPDPAVMMLDKENKWVPARHPLHFDKPKVAGVGPGLSFGREMARQFPGRTIGLIPCAVGGTSINVWEPGKQDESTNTHPYDDAIARLQLALQDGELKGIIWLQGEADANPDKIAIYLDKLIVLVNRFRQIAGNEQVPFVAGELGEFRDRYKSFNNMLQHLPERLPNSAVALSTGLTDKGDQTHFDAVSAEEYGKRFAEKLTKLIHAKATATIKQ